MKTTSKGLTLTALALGLTTRRSRPPTCGSPSGPATRRISAMLNGIAESFTATHPDMTVSFETIPPGDYTQKLTFQLAGGNPPDLGWMMEDAAPAFAAAGVLMDLGPTLQRRRGLRLRRLLRAGDGALDATATGLRRAVLDLAVHDLLQQGHVRRGGPRGRRWRSPPRASGTWTKFQEVAKAMTEADDGMGLRVQGRPGLRLPHHARADAADPRLWRRRLGRTANAASTSPRRSRRCSSCTTWCSRTARSCRRASRATSSPATRR